MAQSKLRSFKEACINIAIGCGISLAAGLILYPIHGATFSFTTNVYLTIEFTVISLIRSYCVRRFMNKGDGK